MRKIRKQSDEDKNAREEIYRSQNKTDNKYDAEQDKLKFTERGELDAIQKFWRHSVNPCWRCSEITQLLAEIDKHLKGKCHTEKNQKHSGVI